MDSRDWSILPKKRNLSPAVVCSVWDYSVLGLLTVYRPTDHKSLENHNASRLNPIAILPWSPVTGRLIDITLNLYYALTPIWLSLKHLHTGHGPSLCSDVFSDGLRHLNNNRDRTEECTWTTWSVWPAVNTLLSLLNPKIQPSQLSCCVTTHWTSDILHWIL